MELKQIYWTIFLVLTLGLANCHGQINKEQSTSEAKVITTGQAKLVKTQHSGSGHNIHASLEDRNGNLWFATTNDGVYFYDGKEFKNYTTKDGLNSNSILAILEDRKGDIWLGTSAGLNRFDGKTFSAIPAKAPFALNADSYVFNTNSMVFSLLEDRKGKLWIATNNGVYCYDGKAFSRFLDSPNLINGNKNLSLAQ